MEYIINFTSLYKEALSKKIEEDKNSSTGRNRRAFGRESSESKDSELLRNIFHKDDLLYCESKDSLFQDYAIEQDVLVEEIGLDRTYNSAQNIRIILDILEKNLNIKKLALIKNIFPTEKKELFEKMLSLKTASHFDDISKLMTSLFPMEWLGFMYNTKPVNKTELPLWKQKLANFLAKKMNGSWHHTFALVGSFGLKEFYGFSLIPSKIDVFARKDDLGLAFGIICSEFNISSEISFKENNSKYGLFELDFSLEEKKVYITEVYPYTYRDSIEGQIFRHTRAARKTNAADVPFLIFDHQLLLLQELLENNIDSIASLYQICLLAGHSERYFEKVKSYFLSKDKEFFEEIINSNKSKEISKKECSKIVMKIWNKIS